MKFYNAGDVMETVGEPIGDYTIVNRNTSYEPWVCAWKLTLKDTYTNGVRDGYWCQGHYFKTFENAVKWATENK